MIGKRVYLRGSFGVIVEDRLNGMYDIELDPHPLIPAYDPELPRSLGPNRGKTIPCVYRDEFELVEVKSDLGRALFDLGARIAGLK